MGGIAGDVLPGQNVTVRKDTRYPGPVTSCVDVSRELPVRVTGVEVQDPVIVLFGDGWSLSVACPWRGVVPELSTGLCDNTGNVSRWSRGGL